jgi:flagellar biosynthesis/type III secretory pathway protein FliH
MSNIETRAMLAAPRISVWTARKLDREVSAEAAERRGTKAKRAGNFNKCLIDPENDLYMEIVQIARESRRWHDEHTLPWGQDGSAILSSAMYEDYTAAMSVFKERFDHAVHEFVTEYEKLVERAEGELAGMYRKTDYPSAQQVEGKFNFSISIFPVPTAGDFRVQLDSDDVDLIKQKLQEEIEGTVRDAEQEKWSRMWELVARAVDRLSNPDAIFRDSLIENLQQAVKVLPKLSLQDDKKFDNIVKEVESKLTHLNPDRLRTDKDVRADAARKAAEIARKMGAYMGK